MKIGSAAGICHRRSSRTVGWEFLGRVAGVLL